MCIVCDMYVCADVCIVIYVLYGVHTHCVYSVLYDTFFTVM